MGILRKLGAATTAVAVVGAGLLAAALPADATAEVVPAAATAPAAAAVPAAATVSTSSTSLVPGTLRLDRRCMTGRILCINKKTRKVVFLYNGKLLATADARFGCSSTPTRNGMFKVYRKSRNHVSSLYHTPMPYAMFFSGGQAVHYSADFAARGYNGCSHGCVNVRDKARIAWIYDRVRIGDRVLVYYA
ncbi:MAG TPA: L,D-transpeptidase [Kribbella sp.]|nr:L,D-transpeptidase [Kribbella sp.]